MEVTTATMCIGNVLCESLNSGKLSVHWTLFFLLYLMVKLAYLNDFSHVKSTVLSQIMFFFPPIHFNKSLLYMFLGLWSL